MSTNAAEKQSQIKVLIALGKEKGYDWNAPKPPGMGYRDALVNLAKILYEQKRWADLKEYCEKDVPEAHVLRVQWLNTANEELAKK